MVSSLLWKAQTHLLSSYGDQKTERAVSRSTTEEEFVALNTALLGEAISLLAVCQRVIDPGFILKCFEDNQAVMARIAKGYSPKTQAPGQISSP